MKIKSNVRAGAVPIPRGCGGIGPGFIAPRK